MAQFETKSVGNKTVLSIEGRLTLDDKSSFDSYVEQNLQENDGSIFGINLIDLEYIDSAGIGDLIKLKMQASKIYEGGVYVFGVEGPVERVFRISGLSSVFEIVSEEEFLEL